MKQYDLVPYHFDPEHLVEEINSHHLITETTVQPPPLFCMTPAIFQNVNNPPKILF